MSSSVFRAGQGQDKHRFEAYTKLLRLRNGGQVEEPTDFSELPSEPSNTTELSDAEYAESIQANTLSRFTDYDKLKKAFLDRLSELVAYEKGGRFVSASLMIEWPDRVDVLLAKNNGFKNGEACLCLLDSVASQLRVISKADPLGSFGLGCRFSKELH